MADVVVTLQQSLALQEQFDSSTQATGSTGFTYKMQYLLFGPRHNSGTAHKCCVIYLVGFNYLHVLFHNWYLTNILTLH
ncbi:hypothetical protein HanPI659440_Chr01g0004681 [Helianthus annuus]|nr:hypothetical protein HanPI659440_Chr01g0004681 [Helianthus annuus]